MKMSTPFTAVMVGSALTLATATWIVGQERQEYQSRAEKQVRDAENKAESAVRDATKSTTSSGQVMKVNKASQLIGMNVKNQQGEKLGRIDEIVLDLSGDKVAYAVLSVSKGAFTESKMHAVPLRAFQASADGTYLTLNADKEKLAQAEGFDKDNWPSVNNPSWGAQPFWQENSKSTTSPHSTYPKTPSDSDSSQDNQEKPDKQ